MKIRINTTWISDRIKEPSTWKGIILLCSYFGYQLSPDQLMNIISGMVFLFGLIEVGRKEKRNDRRKATTSGHTTSGTEETSIRRIKNTRHRIL